MNTEVAVYADWDGLPAPTRLGTLFARRGSRRDVFEFEFERDALANRALTGLPLDPHLGWFEGRQHPPQHHVTFGAFADASPDRWGRVLMQRRLEREQRAGLADKAVRLREIDYLLGVHDVYRAGALRFRRGDSGAFLDSRDRRAAPPWTELRALEAVSRKLERDPEGKSAEVDEWLRVLIAPGGSLGGARPKASVLDPKKRLWIAKFPSVRDEHDVGGWELVVQALASSCGLQVPESTARRFANAHHTFLVKRFDRTASGRRLHFASAMTLTGHVDGDDASTGVSYLELARVLIEHGAQPAADLRELWTRIVFNMLVSNSDDHLRNHGFLLVPGKGWRLSEAYDMNPATDSAGLRLNVSESDNALDLELAREVAPQFRVGKSVAEEIIGHCRKVVRQWPTLAKKVGIPAREQSRMAAAFRLA